MEMESGRGALVMRIQKIMDSLRVPGWGKCQIPKPGGWGWIIEINEISSEPLKTQFQIYFSII